MYSQKNNRIFQRVSSMLSNSTSDETLGRCSPFYSYCVTVDDFVFIRTCDGVTQFHLHPNLKWIVELH